MAKLPEITLAWARVDLEPVWTDYADKILHRHQKDWARTMLAATLWVLRDPATASWVLHLQGLPSRLAARRAFAMMVQVFERV